MDVCLFYVREKNEQFLGKKENKMDLNGRREHRSKQTIERLNFKQEQERSNTNKNKLHSTQ